MEYQSVKQFAEKHGISERSARNYCANGRIRVSQLKTFIKNYLTTSKSSRHTTRTI